MHLPALSRSPLPRRALFIGSLAFAGQGRAEGRSTVRLGLVQFGTVQWIADVIRRHGLDTAHGFALETVPLASPEAGRIAIMGNQADVVVLDWLFVAAQRAAGTKLSFAAFSSSAGGIMGRPGTGISDLAGLRGRRLGVAGGPLDKSWLVVQAAARKAGVDLATAAQVAYGSPPLLEAKLGQGELDAVLTFWNFAARLEAQGNVQLVSVAECAMALGLPPRLGLIGFVFKQEWAEGAAAGLNGFLDAVVQAGQIMASSEEEWQVIRPLMNAPDDVLFSRLRERFTAGIAVLPDIATQERDAGQLLALLKETGGLRATEGLAELPPGLFWHSAHGAG